jgi:hypothetical protein
MVRKDSKSTLSCKASIEKLSWYKASCSRQYLRSSSTSGTAGGNTGGGRGVVSPNVILVTIVFTVIRPIVEVVFHVDVATLVVRQVVV